MLVAVFSPSPQVLTYVFGLRTVFYCAVYFFFPIIHFCNFFEFVIGGSYASLYHCCQWNLRSITSKGGMMSQFLKRSILEPSLHHFQQSMAHQKYDFKFLSVVVLVVFFKCALRTKWPVTSWN
jgi:hypothetical protein